MTISLLGFYMISIYRAMLGASLAVRIFKEPVSELEELLLSDKLQLIIVGRFSKYIKKHWKVEKNLIAFYSLIVHNY